jgi:hypothetical protein
MFDHGGEIFQNEHIQPGGPRGQGRGIGRRDRGPADHLRNQRAAGLEFVVTEASLREVQGRNRRGYTELVLDVQDTWLIQLAGENEPTKAVWVYAVFGDPVFGNISVKDRELLQDAVDTVSDAFLTMERRLPTASAFIQRDTGLRVMRPTTYWSRVAPWLGRTDVPGRPARPVVTLVVEPNHDEPGPVLPDEFDDTFLVGPEPGNSAFFGRNVLQGLVDGIDDFIHERQPRWNRFRSLGPTLIGSAMWINDDVLIDKIAELAAACIVVTKQGRNEQGKLEPLAELNRRTPGMPVHAFAELTELAPNVDGRPVVLGPSSPMYDEPIPTIRTLGFRKSKEHQTPPIIHAKLVLLGHLWWHDEDDSPAGVADVTGFEPYRLWISSANFTSSSRRSLEFGYWTEDRALLEGAERFLVKLMRSSEALDPASDHFEPELVPVD